MRPIMFLAFVVAVFCGPVCGQSWDAGGKVNVPFEFAVGQMILPAGHYQVSTSFFGRPEYLIVKNLDTDEPAKFFRVTTIMVTGFNPSNRETTFVFRQDGLGHVLHQVLFAGDDHIHDVVHGAEVTELQK
jgi:hypothetical protein